MVCFRHIIVNTLHNGDNRDDDDKNKNNNFNPRRRRRKRKRNSVNTKHVHMNGTFTSNNIFSPDVMQSLLHSQKIQTHTIPKKQGKLAQIIPNS
jgi:hypothetical protein